MVKTRVRLAGNFTELGWQDADSLSLAEQCGKRRPDRKAEVVAYLRAGATFVISPGIEADFLDPSTKAGSGSIVTDGVWAWPKTLAYYVERYDVGLPADFEAYMARNEWKVPDGIDARSLELPP